MAGVGVDFPSGGSQLMNWFGAAIVRLTRHWETARTPRQCLSWGLVGVLLLAAGPAQADPLVTDVAFSPRSDGQGYVMRVRTTGRPEA